LRLKADGTDFVAQQEGAFDEFAVLGQKLQGLVLV